MAHKVITLADYARLKGNTYLTTWSKAKAGEVPGAFKDGRSWFVKVEESEVDTVVMQATAIDILTALDDLNRNVADALVRIAAMEKKEDAILRALKGDK